MPKPTPAETRLLQSGLHDQDGIDDRIKKMSEDLAEDATMTTWEAAEFVANARSLEIDAGFVVENIMRLDWFGVKGRHIKFPHEAFLIAITRGRIQEASANVLAQIVVEQAGGSLPTRGESYTAKALAKLNQALAWKQRYYGNGVTRKVRRLFRKWFYKVLHKPESVGGRDMDYRVDSVEIGLRRIHTVDNINFFSVPGLSQLKNPYVQGTPYQRGLRLLAYVAGKTPKTDGVYGYREIIIDSATREIQLGQVNASYAGSMTKCLLALMRSATYFLTAQSLELAGDVRGSEDAFLAASVDLRRAHEKFRYANAHMWYDRLSIRKSPKLPFQPGLEPEMIEQYLLRLSEVVGFSDQTGVSG